MQVNKATSLFVLLCLSLAVLKSQNSKQGMEKQEIIYIYDAHCGWCYGFSDVILQFADKNKSNFNFKVISGGLVIGDRVGPIGDMAEYILKAIPSLEKTTGKKVGQPYIDVLKDGSRIQNSLIPATALCVLKDLLPGKEVELAHKIQELQFVHGHDLQSDETYKELCDELGISPDVFLSKFNSNEYQQKAKDEFAQASSWDIRGFPAVILNHGDSLIALSNGYIDLPSLQSNLQQAQSLQK